jgi:hypothetical protein
MDYFNIDSLQIKDIISNTLKYGIYFIEIVDSENDLKSKKMLTESDKIKTSDYETYGDKKFRINLTGEYSDNLSILEDEDNNIKRDKEEAKNLFYLRYYKPTKIIKIADDITTYGYLEIKSKNDKNIGNIYHNI